MALQIASLNSGSNGNCYYVGNAEEAVLVDAGLSLRETEKRMKLLELDIKKVRAIFISHEHSDHIKGLANVAHKYQIPIYITEKTAAAGIRLIRHLSVFFTSDETIQVGNLIVKTFDKFHDAVDGHSFTISYNNITVGVFTDLGKVCDKLIHHFKQCNAAFLESNYDEEMLANGKYPPILKKRITGGEGHLSNKEAAQLFKEHKPPFMSHLFLAHLSKENNTHELALNEFLPYANGTLVSVASRYNATEVYEITHDGSERKPSMLYNKKPNQLKLF